jgi:Predicted integral membrane protein
MEPISKVNLERLTNGIYAFTMTLMIRNIQLPPSGTLMDAASVDQYLLTTGFSVIDFVGAFLILGMFWLFYFQIFHRMRSVDSRFIYMHLLSLMVVVFVPFTQGLANSTESLPELEVLFQINYFILACLLTLAWMYARTHPALLEPALTPHEATFLSKKFLVPLGVAVVGILLAAAGWGYIDILYFVPLIILGLFFREPPDQNPAP